MGPEVHLSSKCYRSVSGIKPETIYHTCEVRIDGAAVKKFTNSSPNIVKGNADTEVIKLSLPYKQRQSVFTKEVDSSIALLVTCYDRMCAQLGGAYKSVPDLNVSVIDQDHLFPAVRPIVMPGAIVEVLRPR
jgi:hypothetical protein